VRKEPEPICYDRRLQRRTKRKAMTDTHDWIKDNPPNGLPGVLKEMTHCEALGFAMSGGDLMSALIHHGLVTQDDVVTAFKTHEPELWEEFQEAKKRRDVLRKKLGVARRARQS